MRHVIVWCGGRGYRELWGICRYGRGVWCERWVVEGGILLHRGRRKGIPRTRGKGIWASRVIHLAAVV